MSKLCFLDVETTGLHSKLNAIEEAERSRTIIALDAHDWATDVLDPRVVSTLSSQGLNPAQGSGLGGIVIAGMHTSNSTWIPGRLS